MYGGEHQHRAHKAQETEQWLSAFHGEFLIVVGHSEGCRLPCPSLFLEAIYEKKCGPRTPCATHARGSLL